MFVGQFQYTVTKDGRLSLPAKMREVITKKYSTDEVYIVLIPGNVICIYPETEFEKLIEAIASPQMASISELTKAERDICSNAQNSKIDGSGRIVIPLDYKDKAKIDQDVLIIGARTHIELWNPSNWEWYLNNNSSGALNKLSGVR